MGLCSWFMEPMFSRSATGSPSYDATWGASATRSEPTIINPGSGLPMINGIGGIDVGGNTFGSSWHTHQTSMWDSPTFAMHTPNYLGSGPIGGYDPIRGW